MSKPKAKNNSETKKEITTAQIADLVEKTRIYLEKIIGIKLSAAAYEDKEKNFWQIKKGEGPRDIICTIYYYFLSKNELGLWCNLDNFTPGKYSEHDDLCEKVQELGRSLGLTIKDLNKPKRIR